jgi:hypothetical protein
MSNFSTQLDGAFNAGRKGIAYDWQSLIAADGVAAFEAELADMVLEHAE